MTDATLSPSAVELFRQWKELRESGTDTTATLLAQASSDNPALANDLERLIDAYLAGDGVAASTLTEGVPSPEPPPRAPAIPGYTVEAYLGGGGMGEVWRVRDRLDTPLALKLVRADRLSDAARERFLAEGRAMRRLSHPHLLSIHHFDVYEDLPYFTMPPYPASLKDRLTDYQADPKAAVRLMAAVADGVGYLHARGFVHRDLKPGNVLLAEDGTPKVSDFGLVKSLTEDSTPVDPGSATDGSAETFPTGPRRSKTMAGAVLGTRAYMSPEQAAGRSEQSNPRWDVWALGVMLHELLTGRLPPSSAAPERLLEPDAPDNPSPSSFKPGLDSQLERIVRKCLAREEAERYADGAAVGAELHAYRRPIRRQWMLGWTMAIVVLGIVGAVVAVAIGALRSRTTESDGERHERLRRELLAKVQGREPAVLIDAEGRAVHTRPVGARVGTTPVDTAHGFVVSAVEDVLIELVPRDVTGTDFELIGEIRYIRQGDFTSWAGLYYGHNPDGPADGPNHSFVGLVYHEFGGLPIALQPGPGEQIGQYGLWMIHWVNPEAAWHARGPIPTEFYRPFRNPRPPETDEKPWRRLSLRVTGPTVTAEFAGSGSGTADHLAMHRLWMTEHGTHVPRPPFGPAGGLGVYVRNATVAFRNVSIRSVDLTHGPHPGGRPGDQ